MNLLQLAVPTEVFRQPLRQSLLLVSRLQVAGVQFDIRNEVRSVEFGETACRQLRHHLDELRLKVASVTLPTRYPLCHPEQLDARLQAVREGMEFARRLGTGVLSMRLGPLPADASSPEYRRVVELLSDISAHGNRVGTTLALSTLGNSAAALRSLAEQISTGPLGFDFDPAGSIFAGRQPNEELRALHDLVSHLQIRDGLRTEEGAGVETAIGAGEVAWDEVLATLAEMDYRGWMTVRRGEGEDRIEDVTRGVSYVRNVLNS